MTPCPNDDVLGALVQRALDTREVSLVTSHLDDCSSCRQVVIAAVRGGIGIAASRPGTLLAVGTLDPTPPGPLAILPEHSGPAIGDRIGRYQIRGLLGAGGMGRVFEAFDPELDRAVALKVMRPELKKLTSILAERLVRESRLMAKVVHPSVIAVHDVGRTGDAVFIAMDLVRGETLGAYVRRVKPPWREIVGLLVKAGQGLAAAHAVGIVHRDFKPDNVLVELDAKHHASGRVVVTDFGVARALLDDSWHGEQPDDRVMRDSDPQLTATGTTVGTPAYMAPEQLDGRPVDLRADIFAFTVATWELLFGQRPFQGRSTCELRAALKLPLEPPRGHDVPAPVVRTLVRGLALDASDRWQTMDVLLRALSSRLGHRRKRAVAFAAVAVALVGVGLGASQVMADDAADPCLAGIEALDASYELADTSRLVDALATIPARDKVVDKLLKVTSDWRTVHRATCTTTAEPNQPARISTCLEARRLEIEGYVDDVLADGALGAKHASSLSGIIGDPTACADPAPGLLSARVPTDPAVRRQVTAARYRMFDAELARNTGDHQRAIQISQEVAKQAATLWPPLQAEALYVLSTAQTYGGNNKLGMATLRDAAALAERVHHDHIAANTWLQLALTAAFETGDPRRALEYVTYAEAAIDRIGRPPALLTMLEYTRGTSLIEADRGKEAEGALRRAFELAEKHAPEHLPEVIQGLGIMYEEQGRFTDAIDMYRRAIKALSVRGPAVPATEVIIRGRLAGALTTAGQVEEAEVEARRALAIAEKTMADDNLDRSIARLQLGQVLQQRGKLVEALAAGEASAAAIVRILGDRSERYGEALSFVAVVLGDLERYEESVKQFARACDIIAFHVGEGTSRQAECWLREIESLIGLERLTEALALAEKAHAILVKAYHDRHPQVATAYVMRGNLRAELGRPGGIEDLEIGLAIFTTVTGVDPGHLAGVQFALGRVLWKTDPGRARTLVEQALATFETAAASWSRTKADAEAWLAAHPRKR